VRGGGALAGRTIGAPVLSIFGSGSARASSASVSCCDIVVIVAAASCTPPSPSWVVSLPSSVLSIAISGRPLGGCASGGACGVAIGGAGFCTTCGGVRQLPNTTAHVVHAQRIEVAQPRRIVGDVDTAAVGTVPIAYHFAMLRYSLILLLAA